jgi:3-oxoacyl-[acyl-carrier protein] reductase
MDLGLNGKKALITGGARGIGAAIALELSKLGVDVIITDINEENAPKTLENIKSHGGTGYFYAMNVTDMNSVEDCVEKIQTDIGKIDILINNAGVTKDKLFVRMKEEDWDFVLNVNLKGVFNCTRVVAPKMMKNKWGRIINISSVVGVMGNIGQANYAASKAGVIGLTKTCARELASRNITVNAIAPGFIKSDMTDALSEDVSNNLLAAIPLKRLGTPEEVANLVCFLASEQASYITGQTIGLNGGMLM